MTMLTGNNGHIDHWGYDVVRCPTCGTRVIPGSRYCSECGTELIGGDCVYECFHCGSRSVIWDCDYSFEDFGYEGEGIVQTLHCENCGAEIEYRIYLDDGEQEDGTVSEG